MVILTGTPYYTSVPDGYVRVDSMVELFELKPKKKKFVKSNLQFADMDVLVYSHYADRYYVRPLRAQLEDHMRTFVRQGCVYMPRERKCLTDEIMQRETLLMIEYYEGNKHLPSRETQLKLLKQQL